MLTTRTFAGLVLDYVFYPFGLPSSIISDRGSLFTSNFWTTFYIYLLIEQQLSIAYYL